MSTENGAWRNCEKSNSPEDSAACNFRPDYELSTPRAQQWAKDSQVQRSKPLELDQNGMYQVQWGDSLSTVAERALKGQGAAVNKDSLRAMQDAIVEANHDRYKTLDCNRDFMSEKWKLKIPCPKQEEPPVKEQPPVTYEPPVRIEPRPVEPEYPVRRPCPPEERPMPRPMPPQDYNDCPPRMPMIINQPGGVVNIFMGRGGWDHRPQFDNQNNWGRERDYYQFNDYDRPQIRPLPYRPDYYHEPYRPEPEGCGPCDRRQYWHNQRMPQVLRRNPNYR